MAANAQKTSYVDVTSLTSCQDLAPYCAKFEDDIASDTSDRRHLRRDTRLRFVTFWAGCYEVTLP